MAAIAYSSRAREWLENAAPDVQEQVLDRLERAAEFPDHYLTRLTNSPFYKLRAGDYRAIVDWRREDGVLFVRTIGHRRNVYR